MPRTRRVIYALYNGARFVFAGTPSGVTLAPEGGAHQSTITPSIGLELPGLTYAEPAYARALDWLLCDGLPGWPNPTATACTYASPPAPSTRLRSSRGRTAAAPTSSVPTCWLVATGCASRSIEPADVIIAACGAVVPEAIEAAGACTEEGLTCVVLDITSADRLYREWRATLQRRRGAARWRRRRSTSGSSSAPTSATCRSSRSTTPRAIAVVAGKRLRSTHCPRRRRHVRPVGPIHDLYGAFDLRPEQIVNAALVATAGLG